VENHRKKLGKVTPLRLTEDLYERPRGGKLTTGHSGYQETCRRILACGHSAMCPR
jgi:hypothetical protein